MQTDNRFLLIILRSNADLSCHSCPFFLFKCHSSIILDAILFWFFSLQLMALNIELYNIKSKFCVIVDKNFYTLPYLKVFMLYVCVCSSQDSWEFYFHTTLNYYNLHIIEVRSSFLFCVGLELWIIFIPYPLRYRSKHTWNGYL